MDWAKKTIEAFDCTLWKRKGLWRTSRGRRDPYWLHVGKEAANKGDFISDEFCKCPAKKVPWMKRNLSESVPFSSSVRWYVCGAYTARSAALLNPPSSLRSRTKDDDGAKRGGEKWVKYAGCLLGPGRLHRSNCGNAHSLRRFTCTLQRNHAQAAHECPTKRV